MNNIFVVKAIAAFGQISKLLMRATRSTTALSFSLSLVLGLVLYAGPSTQASAHSLPTRHVYLFFDGFTLDFMNTRVNTMGDPIFLNGDEVGFIIKIVPRDGTSTGAGGHADFYVPNGTEVIDAAFIVPGTDLTDGIKNFDRAPMGAPSVITEGIGAGGAATPALTTGAGATTVQDTCPILPPAGAGGPAMGPNINNVCADRVTPTGVHRGTIAGVYGDTGIFYATDPDTAYGSWQRYTASFGGAFATDADGDCGIDVGQPGIVFTGVELKNNSGDVSIPCNKWDAEQLFAYGINGVTHTGAGDCLGTIHGCVDSPILDINGRGHSPWGFASGVPGPESGYAWQFDWEEYIAHRATDPTFNPANPNAGVSAAFEDEARRQAMDNSEVGPWKRIQYFGSRISFDTPGNIGTNLVDTSLDGATTGFALSPATPLPATVSQTDTTSTKTIRFSIGQTNLEEPEAVWVKIRILDAAAMVPAGECPELYADTFGGDAGGPDGGKDHLWRYYEPSRASLNLCAAIGKPVANQLLGPGTISAYNVEAFNTSNNPLTGVIIRDTIPAGVNFINATPIAPTSISGSTLFWDLGLIAGFGGLGAGMGILNGGQGFATDINFEVTGTGTIDNTVCMFSNEVGDQCALETVVSETDPILVLEKTAASGFIVPGGTVDYTVTVSNIGFSQSSDKPATVIDSLPTGFTFTPNIVGGVVTNASVVMNGSPLPVTTGDANGVPTSTPEFRADNRIQVGQSMVLTFTADVADPLPLPLLDEYCNSYQFYSKDPTKDFEELFDVACVALSVIRGNVSEDTTGDGAGDTPLANTTLLLYTDAGGATPTGVPGTFLESTTTDASGVYEFSGRTDDNYVIVEVDPAGLSSVSDSQSVDNDVFGNPNTNDNRIAVTMSGAEEDNNNNFVDFRPASLAGTVWFDEDQDGLNDIEEARFTDIRVELQDGTCTAGVDCPIVTTDSNGKYVFEGLYPNTYTVNVFEVDLPGGLTNTAGVGGVEPKSVPVAAGENVTRVDFGYIPVVNTGAIGDRVWADADADGIQDPGESGIAGVTLTLLDAAGAPVGGPVTTNANGDYLFTNVPFGNDYTVTISPADAALVGFVPTTGPQSEGGFVGHPVTLNAALTVVTDVDFGFDDPNTNTLIDKVFYDENSDGVFNGTDKGLADVSVDLLNAAGAVVASALSDGNGDVGFTGLDNGTYSLRLTDTTSVLNGLSGTTLEGVARLSDSVTFSLGTPEVDDQDSFGFVNAGLIAGTIYSDADSNSDQNGGEPGLSGVTVTLLRDMDGDTIYETTVASVMTSPDGSYSFDGLSPGDYRVMVTPPAGVQFEDPDASTDNQTDITLALGASSIENDFGYFNAAFNDITGTVFLDLDKDGLRELAQGETGFESVTLQLLDSGGNVVASTTTAADGSYSFPGLPNGSYQVAVTDTAPVLGGYDLTSGLDVLSVVITGADVSDVDFGYIKDELSGSISGEVFLDENADNNAQATEANFSGVDVFLCRNPLVLPDVAPCDPTDVTGFVAQTVTDANGEYAFFGLQAGSYLVDVDTTDVPANLNQTVDPAPVALSEGENIIDVDHGFVTPANFGLLSGVVWTDNNANGVYDAGEAPIGGVDINIFDPASATPLVPIGTAVTANDGSWSFVLSTVAGTLVDDLIVEYDAADIPANLDSAQPSNLVIGVTRYEGNKVDALSDADNTIGDLSFGFAPDGVALGSISGTIYSDVDSDSNYVGATDGEYQGVTLNLLDASGNIIATTVTDANGNYSFTGLQPDAVGYSVVVTDVGNVLQNVNLLETISNPIPLALGQVLTGIDQGYISTTTATLASIGNRIFVDANQNGFADEGEPGVPGVTVQCWVDTDNSATVSDPFVAVPAGQPQAGVDNLVRTVTTDLNGEFYCTNLPAGQYIVTVTDANGVLTGFNDTSPNNAANNAADNFAKPFTYAVNLAAGVPDLSADFGIEAAQQINGIVYLDDNADGDYQLVGDLVSAGRQVQACNAATGLCLTVFTDASGAYSVPVGVGSWTVTVLTPPASTDALEVPAVLPIVVAVNDIINDVDFGFIDPSSNTTGSITGAVLEDTTGDGVGDTAIANAIVQLYTDAGGATPTGVPGTLIGSTTTNGLGAYTFSGVPSENFNYVIVEVDPATYASVADVQSVDDDVLGNALTNDNLLAVTLTPAETDANNNFVDLRPGSIAGTVWLDEDRDGINDIEEAGLTGIEVELRDTATNALIATVGTNANGDYAFHGLVAGDYTLVVVPAGVPAGLALTAGQFGAPTRAVTLPVLGVVTDEDFGYRTNAGTGAIGDRVWSDAIGIGFQNPGEPGIAGVSLTLLDADGAPVGGPVTTNANGDYLFTNVPFGKDYTVNINPADAQLVGYIPTTGPQSEGGYVGNPVSLHAQLTVVTDIDFGFNSFSANNTLVDKVWFDSNNNGVFDGNEAPISGVSVNLYADDGAGNPVDADGDGQPDVIATVLTGLNGEITFSGLVDGDYIVAVTDINAALNGLNGTTQPALDTLTAAITVAGGIPVANTSFGYNNPGLIAGTIYNDADNNSDQTAAENGISGVTVTLRRDTDGNTANGYEAVVTSIVTGADGAYNFDGLPAAEYQVVVTPPPGTQSEDPDASVDAITNISLGLAASSVANDFGYNNPTLNDIAGTVFLDSDKDGLQDAPEGGLVGITIELVGPTGEVIAVATTDVNGEYNFDDLPNGDYIVRVSDTAHFLAGYDITSGLDALPVTLAGAPVADVDFGYVKDEATGSISGEVFIDESGNDLAESEEFDLSGVTVWLCAATEAPCTAGNAIATTTTDVNGEYVFTGLPAGVYEVGTDSATVPANLTLGADPDPVSLSEGEKVKDVDIGYDPAVGTGILSGVVWADADNDGNFDPGEAPIAGLIIRITDATGTPITTATSSADGSWMVTGITGGDLQDDLAIFYDFADPAIPVGLDNDQPSNLPIGDTHYLDQDLLSDPDKNIGFLDFGFPPEVGTNLGLISGTIYSDADQNGDYLNTTDGEFAGVTLNLFDSGGNLIASTITDANGLYTFSGLQSGTYTVAISDVNNVLGNLSPNELLPSPITIIDTTSLDPNDYIVTDQDAGFQSGATLSDRDPVGNKFWFDSNGDGVVQDGEPGVPGITMQIWVDNDLSETPDNPMLVTGAPLPGVDNLVRTIVTDAAGEYYFTNLPAGQYIVVVADSLGFVEGTDGTTVPGLAADNNAKPWTYALTHTGTSSNLSADFGITGSNTLSGMVFIEEETQNPDALFNGTDTAGVGVPVILLLQLPDLSYVQVQNTTTDGSGNYSFAGLPNGNYRVVVEGENSVIDGFTQTADPDLLPAGTVCDSMTQAECNSAHDIALTGTGAAGIDFGYHKDYTTTPVTVNYFTAKSIGGGVQFNWETSNEVGNLGYQIYARGGDDWVLLNEALITSGAGGAMDKRSYSYTAYNVDAKWFALVDVSAGEGLTPHGPFKLDQAYGAELDIPAEFDWQGIAPSRPTKSQVENSVNYRLNNLLDPEQRPERQ